MDRIIQGVYQIKCVLNGCVYIGSSNNIERRLRQHFKHLRAGKHGNYKLQADFNSMGEIMFVTSTLQESHFKLRTELYNLEQVWIDKIRYKYNILEDAKGHLKKELQDLPSLDMPSIRRKPKQTGRKKKLAKDKRLYSSSTSKNLTSRKFQENEPIQRRIRRKTKEGDIQEWNGTTLIESSFPVKPKKAKGKLQIPNYAR